MQIGPVQPKKEETETQFGSSSLFKTLNFNFSLVLEPPPPNPFRQREYLTGLVITFNQFTP